MRFSLNEIKVDMNITPASNVSSSNTMPHENVKVLKFVFQLARPHQ